MDECLFPGQHVAYYGTYPPLDPEDQPQPLFCGVVVNTLYKQTQIYKCADATPRGTAMTVVTTNFCETVPFCIHNPTIGWVNNPAIYNFGQSYSLTDVDNQIERLIAIHDPVTLLKIAKKLHSHSKKELKKVVKHFGKQPTRRKR